MKKYGLLIATGLVLIGFIAYQFVKISNLTHELEQKEKEVMELESSNQVVYVDAVKVGERFILGYFNFHGHPVKEDVEDYLSSHVLNELNFSPQDEYDEGLNEINSSVNRLNIYFGEAVEGRQKLLGVFINVLEINGEKTSTNSFIELDLENTESGWEIVDFHFFQY